MPLSQEEVETTARLARLRLSEEELTAFAAELSQIIDYVSALKELDTRGVEPLTHAVPMSLRTAPDIPEAPLPVELALSQAPQSKDDCFQVPHIIPAK
jgi:aspartyl-tRNA(Asn)/glutamyl-tRNA(Gln) amidotransferase subunit C